jgi:dolichyl-phosphate-mannose-protein mannosyltransferase
MMPSTEPAANDPVDEPPADVTEDEPAADSAVNAEPTADSATETAETAAAATATASELTSARARLAATIPGSRFWGWAGPLLVTVFGGFLRFNRLSVPRAVIFDETYYVPDSWSILKHGVEIDHVKNVNALILAGSKNFLIGTQAEYVAHPPLAKIMMAVGEWLFGLTPFGWRFASCVVGTLAILMTARIARRMTRSTLLGCVAGLLLSLDGLEFVLSRTGILDIFVMFWVLAAFGLIVLDRDQVRARLAAATDAAATDAAPRLGVRWPLVLAGACLGAACASKWNGVWYIPLFGVLVIAWEMGSRRLAGSRTSLADVLRSDGVWLPVWFVIVPVITYTASWTGWFLTSYGYNRNGAALNGGVPTNVLAAWLAYNKSMLTFGLGLSTGQNYRSNPIGWLVLQRPISFWWSCQPVKSCGSPGSTAAEVLAIGTPLIWWAGSLALVACIAWWVLRRDWRPAAVVLGVAAGWLPWIWFWWHDNRTEFYYYAVVFDPFLVIAITLCLGLIIGRGGAATWRRMTGAAVAGAYLLAVVANFAYIYPILSYQVIPYTSWLAKMWFSSWI